MKSPTLSLLALLVGTATFPGCTPGFDEPTTVKDLRILAITADPPEIMLEVGELATLDRLPSSTEALMDKLPALIAALPEQFPPVTLVPLIADPRGGGRTVRLRAVVCASGGGGRERERDMGPGSVSDTAQRQGCSPLTTLIEGVEARPAGDPPAPTIAPTIRFTPTREQILQALAADPLGVVFNLPITIEITASAGEEVVVARKRVVFTPRVAPDQAANANPALTGLAMRGLEGQPIVPVGIVDPMPPAIDVVGRKLRLYPTGMPEMYDAREYDRASGRLFVRQGIREVLRFAFLTTRGEFGPGQVSSQPSPVRGAPAAGPSVEYRAPDDAARGEMVPAWIVVRDERGGSSVSRIDLLLH